MINNSEVVKNTINKRVSCWNLIIGSLRCLDVYQPENVYLAYNTEKDTIEFKSIMETYTDKDLVEQINKIVVVYRNGSYASCNCVGTYNHKMLFRLDLSGKTKNVYVLFDYSMCLEKIDSNIHIELGIINKHQGVHCNLLKNFYEVSKGIEVEWLNDISSTILLYKLNKLGIL